MNYPYRNQYYLQDLQAMKDRIDNQIREYQNNSIAPQPITQNFQITPQQNSRRLEDISEMAKESDKNAIMRIAQKEKESYSQIKQLMEK